MMQPCFLVLGNGKIFGGRGFGSPTVRPSELAKGADVSRGAGEVVFNTGMSGYHEILTDPSYTGQIVMLTYPHAGNYGDFDEWSEIGPEAPSRCGIKAAGLIVRSVYTGPVPAGRISLNEFMKRHGISGITEVDTRALTLHLREFGSTIGILVRPSDENAEVLSREDLTAVREYLEGFPSMEGRALIDEVGTGEKTTFNAGGSRHIVILDCGSKANIIRELLALDCRVTVVPSGTSAPEILAEGAEAVLVSNGPGDPAVLDRQITTVKNLIGKIPLFGICLGHQLIALALGCRTYKLKFGHHGINNPVRDETTGRILVTSQNHGFAVDAGTFPGNVAAWFTNANDGSNEGLFHEKLPIASVQFHPESSPGPVDSRWIFTSFLDRIPAIRNAVIETV